MIRHLVDWTTSGWKAILFLLLLGAGAIYISYSLEPSRNPASAPAAGSGRNGALRSHNLESAPADATAGPPASAAILAPVRDPAARPPEPESLHERLGRPVQVLTGRVVDTAGKPVPDAEVAFGDRKTSTDSQGEFALPQGSADLAIRHPRFFPKTLRPEERSAILEATADPQESHIIIVLFGGGTIRGRITGAGGKPVAGAEVRFSSADHKSPEGGPRAVSDADGAYQSPILPPGSHHLFFRHADYQSQDASVNLPADTLEARFDAALKSGVRFTVRIADRDGKPLPDARIWLISRDARTQGEASRFLGASGDSGILEARWEPGQSHRLRVTLPGYREIEQPVYDRAPPPSGSSSSPVPPPAPSSSKQELAAAPSPGGGSGGEVSIRLEPAAQATGLIIDKKTGLPAAPLRITLEMATPDGFQRAADRGSLFHSLPPGQFRLGLPSFPGSYRIAVLAEKGLSGTSEPFEFDGLAGPPPLTIHLEERGGIQGAVTAAGKTPEGARVELYRDVPGPRRVIHGMDIPSPPDLLQTQTAGAGGKFVFTDVAAGVYRIRASHPDYAEFFSAPVQVPSPLPVPLPMKRGATLSGKIFNLESLPESSLPLILAQKDHPFPRFRSTGAEGGYEFPGLPDGDYILLIGDPESRAEEAVSIWSSEPEESEAVAKEYHPLEIRDGKDLAFDIHLKNIDWGTVFGNLQADGSPVAGAELRLAAREGGNGRRASLRTDAKGGFRFHGLPPGVYNLRCAYPPIDETIPVARGSVSRRPIELHTRKLISRLIRWGKGTPIPGAAQGEIYFENSTRSQFSIEYRDGRAEVAGLFPGRYRLRISAVGFLSDEVRFQIDGQSDQLPAELVTELRRGMRVGVTLLDAAGKPVRAADAMRGPAEVVLLRDDVEMYRSFGVLQEEILLPELAPGIYQLTIRNEAALAQSRFQVKAPDGETLEAVDQKIQVRMKPQ